MAAVPSNGGPITSADEYVFARGGYVCVQANGSLTVNVELPGGTAGSAGDDAVLTAGGSTVVGPVPGGTKFTVTGAGAGVIFPVDKIT